MAGDDAVEGPLGDAIGPFQGFLRRTVEDQGLQDWGDDQFPVAAQGVKGGFPVGLPLEGEEAKVATDAAIVCLFGILEGGFKAGHLGAIGPEVEGKQSNAFPAFDPIGRGILDPVARMVPRVEQQGLGSGVDNSGWFLRNGQHRIGHQQRPRVMVQHGDFLEGSETEIDRPQNRIAKLLQQRRIGLTQAFGPRSWQPQPTQRQVQRETPLMGCDPHLGCFEPPGKGSDVDLVFQA